MSIITDEIVEKAASAIFLSFYGGSSGLDDHAAALSKQFAITALEAVADDIIEACARECTCEACHADIRSLKSKPC